MKITKRVREDAALLCAIAASTPDVGIGTAARLLDGDLFDAVELALEAQSAACSRWNFRARGFDYAFTYADAESLLRTGWSPK